MRMMKLSMMVVGLTLSVGVYASDYDFVADGVYYHFHAEDNSASVASRSGYNTTIPEYEGDIIVPAQVTYNGRTMDVTKVETHAFWYSKNLQSVVLPNSVTKIEITAFSKCTGLKSVVLPNAITEIQSDMFNGCSSLTDIEIPATVTKMGDHVFEGCSSLKTIVIPNSVTKIGSSTFKDCTALENVTLSENLIRTGSFCFQNCTSLKTIHLPTSGKLQFIDIHCFEYCTNLTAISIPRGVKITNAAFYQCTNLHKLVLGEEGESSSGITFADYKYPKDAPFGGCTIDTICYRYNVSMEGVNIFYSREDLKVLYIGGAKPLKMYRFGENIEKVYAMFQDPTISACIFPDKVYVNATLYVPIGTKEKYMAAAGWKNFFNIVETEYDTGISNLPINETEELQYYDLNGRRFNQLQPGINIVRTNKGKVKKVIGK